MPKSEAVLWDLVYRSPRASRKPLFCSVDRPTYGNQTTAVTLIERMKRLLVAGESEEGRV